MKIRFFTITFLCLCVIWSTGSAQSWTWAVRGGAPINGLNVYPQETVTDMGTDSHGNVYVLSVLESSPVPYLGSTALTGYGGRDIMVASYSCDGRMRWYKLIGSYTDDLPCALRIDANDHIYVSGHITSQPPAQTAFGTDTLLPASNLKALFLARYDTSGHLDWLRQPTPDTAGFINGWVCRPYEISLDKAQNVYLLAYLYPGQLADGTGFIVDSAAPYILKYSPSGSLLHIYRPPMDWEVTPSGLNTNMNIHMVHAPNDHIVISGDADYAGGPPTFSLGGVLQKQMSFAAEIDLNTNSILWQHHSDSAGFVGRPVMDTAGNFYFAGSGVHMGSMAGYTINNPTTGNITCMLMKLDSAGNKVWASNAQDNAGSLMAGIAMRAGELVVTGSYPGSLSWGSQAWANPPNTGYDIFIAHFDVHTGDILAIDSVKSPTKQDDYASAIVTDRKGNIFIGGKMTAQLSVGSLTPLYTSGGDFDFFFCRWGYDCSCTGPKSSFKSSAINDSDYIFTYTGTMPADSIRWYFGDGHTTSGATAAHTFSFKEKTTVCATVYTNCGIDDTCMEISIGSGLAINDISGLSHELHVYPVPAQQYVQIDGNVSGSVTVTNILGQTVLQTSVQQGKVLQLDISAFTNGIYTVQVTDATGKRYCSKMIVAH